jgi:hypothetical protein
LLVAVYFLPSFLVVAIGKGQLQNRHPKARQLESILGLLTSLTIRAQASIWVQRHSPCLSADPRSSAVFLGR